MRLSCSPTPPPPHPRQDEDSLERRGVKVSCGNAGLGAKELWWPSANRKMFNIISFPHLQSGDYNPCCSYRDVVGIK